MRELLGKIPTKIPFVSQKVYRSELVYCCECQRTVPIGIEVIIIKSEGGIKKVLKHKYYCRAHGSDYVTQLQN